MVESPALQAFAERHKLAVVALFGSAARGADSPGDLDLAIQPLRENQAGSCRLAARALMAELGRGDLDVAWLPHAGSLLWKEVARDGRVLYESSPGLFESLRAEAVRRHWDGDVWRQRKREFTTRMLEGRLALNRELVEERLAAVAEYLAKLEILVARPELDFTTDFTQHHAAERLLELLVEHAAEVNAEVGQAVAKVAPSDYYTSFFTMAQTGWITAELARDLAPLAGLRNLLVHRYRQVTLSDLYADLKNSVAHWKAYLAQVQAALPGGPAPSP